MLRSVFLIWSRLAANPRSCAVSVVHVEGAPFHLFGRSVSKSSVSSELSESRIVVASSFMKDMVDVGCYGRLSFARLSTG